MTVADFSILSVAVKLPVGFQKVNTNGAVPEGSVQLVQYAVQKRFQTCTVDKHQVCLFQAGHIRHRERVIMQAANLPRVQPGDRHAFHPGGHSAGQSIDRICGGRHLDPELVLSGGDGTAGTGQQQGRRQDGAAKVGN